MVKHLLHNSDILIENFKAGGLAKYLGSACCREADFRFRVQGLGFLLLLFRVLPLPVFLLLSLGRGRRIVNCIT